MNRWLDRLITLVLLALFGWGGATLVHWLVIAADWSVVTTNLPLYALGSYPPDQRWRPLVWISALILLILFTLLGPQVVDFDQLGLVQERNGSRLPFTAPRNTYRTKDGKWVSISGSAQSTFERMCEALEVPELVNDPRFLDNRLRIQNAVALDDALQAAIEKFDRDALIALFDEFGAAVAPCNSIAEIFDDEHFKARENIVAVEDDELGEPIRMQNVVGKMSRTPGGIRHAGPKLGSSNRDILIERLGFNEAELKEAGLPVD